jgi:hypothetical protein
MEHSLSFSLYLSSQSLPAIQSQKTVFLLRNTVHEASFTTTPTPKN